MVSQADELPVRVNGALLPTYTGKPVCLAGTVEQVDSSGSSLMVRASDGKMVKVILSNPLMDAVEGMIEVFGTGQGQQIYCDTYLTFPQMPANDFDAELYDDLLKIMQQVPYHSSKMEDF